jgi:hypothetical protein
MLESDQHKTEGVFSTMQTSHMPLLSRMRDNFTYHFVAFRSKLNHSHKKITKMIREHDNCLFFQEQIS